MSPDSPHAIAAIAVWLFGLVCLCIGVILLLDIKSRLVAGGLILTGLSCCLVVAAGYFR